LPNYSIFFYIFLETRAMKTIWGLILLVAGCTPLWAVDLPLEARLEQAMLGDHRSSANQTRNRYRHPLGTLTFLGLQDDMTVLEIWPGGGWYTEILAPAIKHKGQYVVASYDMDVAGQPEYRYRLHKQLLEKFGSDPKNYDQVAVLSFSPPESASLGNEDSVDLILTFRNVHGWVSDQVAEQIFAEFSRVLKPGGILGVVQHRAAEDSDPMLTAKNGYVSEQAVIALARDAGLYLEARSEVNANPGDTTDHVEGVWSLPPSLDVCGDMEDDSARADCEAPWMAIGESDRMSLRFRKPLE
jgi:predicted methyltransferase